MVVNSHFSPAPSGAPQRLTSDVRSSRVVNISWQPPVEERQNGDIRQYRITLREIPTGRVWSLITITTSHLLDFLHPYYIYTVRVAAYTVAIGPYSESLQFITHEDGKTQTTHKGKLLTVWYSGAALLLKCSI